MRTKSEFQTQLNEVMPECGTRLRNEYPAEFQDRFEEWIEDIKWAEISRRVRLK